MRIVLGLYAAMVMAATAAAFGGSVSLSVVWLTVMSVAVVMLDRDRSRVLVPDCIPASWSAD